MLFFITIVHIIVAVTLVVLVLLQDSKGGGVLGVGGGGANSLLGATGAQTLFAKMTRWVAVVFAVTCLFLTYETSKSGRSVIDGTAIPAALPTAPQSMSPGETTQLPTPESASSPTAPAEPKN